MNRIIIDVREPFEFVSDHVAGAINIPPAQLMRGLPKELQSIPKETELVVYCRTGSRSSTAIHILRSHGFTNLINGINRSHVETRYS